MTAGTVLAHAPVVERKDASPARPIRITWSLDTSIAIYAYFESKEDVDVVSFNIKARDARKGVRLYLHTLVPACSAYAKLLPAVAVVGPGLSAPKLKHGSGNLPFQVKPGEGVQVLRNTQQGVSWYEPYSKKNYFWQQDLLLSLTEPGDYRLYAWSPDKRTGDYVLAIGTRERWGPREIIRATRHMPRLLSDREIHDHACRLELQNQEPSPNPLPTDIHGSAD